jgi:hypothetical protein
MVGVVVVCAVLWNASEEKTEEVSAGVPFADPEPITAPRPDSSGFSLDSTVAAAR